MTYSSNNNSTKYGGQVENIPGYTPGGVGAGGSYGIPPLGSPAPAPTTSGSYAPLAGPNPTATQPKSTSISGSAQGMPAPKAYGSYTPGPQTNQYGSWGGESETGIPGDINGSPQGAPSGLNQQWSTGSAPNSPSASGTAPVTGGGSGVPPDATGNFASSGPISSAPGGEAPAVEHGGPIPGIKHTSKKSKGYDTGGSVDSGIPDPDDAIPDDPDDPSDMQDTSPTDTDTSGGNSENQQLMAAIQKTLQYGQQKNGLPPGLVQQAFGGASKPAGAGGDQPNTNPFGTKTPSPAFGKKTAANAPMVPAGPGGDQPSNNPFPVKTPNPPFGKLSQNDDSDQDDQAQSAASGGVVFPSGNKWNFDKQGYMRKIGKEAPPPPKPLDIDPTTAQPPQSGIPDDKDEA